MRLRKVGFERIWGAFKVVGLWLGDSVFCLVCSLVVISKCYWELICFIFAVFVFFVFLFVICG